MISHSRMRWIVWGAGVAALLGAFPLSAQAQLSIDSLIPLANPSNVNEGVVDPINHVGFIAAGFFSSHYGDRVEVVNLQTMAILGTVLLPHGVGGAAVIDSAHGFAYFSGIDATGNTAVIYQINTTTYLVDQTIAVPGLAFVTSGVIDNQGFAYFGGTNSSLAGQAVAVRLNINPASPASYLQQTVLDLNTAGSAIAAAIDTTANRIYFGDGAGVGSSNLIQPVDIAGGAFNRLASLTLQADEILKYNAAVVDANGNSYFSIGLQSGGSEILQITPSLARADVLDLPGQSVTRASIDPADGFAFFYSPVGNLQACVSAPCVARVYQMNISTARGPIGQLFDGIGLGNSDFYSAALLIDPALAALYVGKTFGGHAFGGQATLYQLNYDAVNKQLLITINPTSAAANSPTFTLTLNDVNAAVTPFQNPNAIVYWNEDTLPTLSETASKIQATVDTSLLTPAGAFAGVQVANLDGHLSNVAPFSIKFPPPTITAFTARSPITLGQSSTLSWQVANATSVFINQGIGTVSNPASGSVPASPTVDTVYTLTAYSPGGQVSANATVTVLSSDLEITKQDSVSGQATLGQNFDYTLTVQNHGAASTNGSVTITDTILNAGVQLVALPVTCSGAAIGANSPFSFTCTLTAIAANTTAPVLTITVKPTAITTVANNATIPADSSERLPVLHNHASQISTVISERADLGMTKTDSVAGSGVLNIPYTYILGVHNYGPSDATTVNVIDLLPAGLTLTSLPAGCSGAVVGDAGPKTLTCTVGSLTSGSDAAALVIGVKPTQAGATVNTATVTSDAMEPASDPHANTAADTVNVALVDLEITKQDSVGLQAALGQNFDYLLTVQNHGGAPSGNVVITDAIQDPGVQLVSLPISCSGAAPGAASPLTLTCVVSAIAANSTAPAVTITVKPTAMTSVINKASILPDPSEPVPVLHPHAAQITTVILERADLGITKTDSAGGSGVLNSPYAYTLGVHNFGPSDATNVQAVDHLPAGLTLTSLPPSCAGAAVNDAGPKTLTCSLGALVAGGDAAPLSIGVKPTLAGALVNTADVASDATEPAVDPHANSASDTVTILIADLELSKQDSVSGQAAIGANFNYVLSVQNHGGAPAGLVTITDTIQDPGVKLVSLPPACSGAAPGADSPLSFTCTLNSVAAFTTAPAFTITVKPTAIATVTNRASIAADPSEQAPVLHSHAAQVTTVILERADLGITKTDSVAGSGLLNTPYTYTLGVHNYGPSDATTVRVIDDLPAGLMLTSLPGGCSGAAVGDAGPKTVTCTVGTIPNGVDAAAIVIGVKPLVAAAIINSADVASDATEPASDPHSNTAADTVQIHFVDLEITKQDSVGGQAPLGQNFTYTITVQNHGDAASRNVVMTDTLSNANVQLGALPPGCTFAGPQAFSCTVGSIAAGATAPAIHIPATAMQLGSASNTVTIPVDPAEPAPVAHAHNAQVTTQIVIIADLKIAQAISVIAPGTIYTGKTLTYNLVVTNLGPSPVPGAAISVQDDLPAEVTYLSSTIDPADGACNASGNTFRCSFARILNTGDQVAIAIVVTATQAGSSVQNTSVIAPDATVVDPNLTNNNATTVVTILEAPYLAAIVVAPDGKIIGLKDLLPLAARAFDQYNNDITDSAALSWSIDKPAGTLDVAGAASTFRATSASASYQVFTIKATAINRKAQTIEGSAHVTVIDANTATGDICGAHAFPVPWKPSMGVDFVTFTHLAPNSRVRIFTADGRKVKEFHSDFGEQFKWHLDNDDGSKVASWVYLYIVDQPNGECPTKDGKIVIIK